MRVQYFTSWSYSRYGTYQQCPLKARLQYIDKLPTPAPKSAALERGGDIHKDADRYLRGETRTVPASLKPVTAALRGLRTAMRQAGEVLIEETIALKADWTPTVWNDWNGCWLRIKMDLGYSGGKHPSTQVVDFKTGKFKETQAEDYLEQLDLYALGALVRWPGVPVAPRLLYTDLNLSYPAEPRVYEPGELPALKKAWTKRVTPMMKDRRFAPKPNWACGYCEYGVSKGSVCKYG